MIRQHIVDKVKRASELNKEYCISTATSKHKTVKTYVKYRFYKVWLKGDTYPVKELLKHNGFTWDAEIKGWVKSFNSKDEILSYIEKYVSNITDITIKPQGEKWQVSNN